MASFRTDPAPAANGEPVRSDRPVAAAPTVATAATGSAADAAGSGAAAVTRLREIASYYDAALEALMRDDLARVERLLGNADRMLDALASAPPTDLPLDEWARTQESLGRLLSAMGNVREETLGELQRVRKGKHALRGYAARREATGGQHDSDV